MFIVSAEIYIEISLLSSIFLTVNNMLCKVVLTFEPVDEILKCDHLNESY